VRELRNVLERAALLTDGTTIDRLQVERALSTSPPSTRLPATTTMRSAEASPAEPSAMDTSLRGVERAALREQLQAHHGSRAELARKLGISERSLYRKLRQLGDT
jgi:DNA-binding NtrC family response regulator